MIQKFKEIWSPQTIINADEPGYYNTHFKSYGLGFFIQDVKGYKELSHTGGLEGMVTQITIIPELQLGIIVLTNQKKVQHLFRLRIRSKTDTWACCGKTGLQKCWLSEFSSAIG
jgi:hypothetical protein